MYLISDDLGWDPLTGPDLKTFERSRMITKMANCLPSDALALRCTYAILHGVSVFLVPEEETVPVIKAHPEMRLMSGNVVKEITPFLHHASDFDCHK